MAIVLTVCQPWAEAIVSGKKTVENRNWRTSCRGRLYIHASKSHQWLAKAADMDWPATFGVPLPSYHALTYGAVLGHVELVDCVPVSECHGDPWAFGPYCWVLANAVRFAEPVACAGHLSLWRVADELLPKVNIPK